MMIIMMRIKSIVGKGMEGDHMGEYLKRKLEDWNDAIQKMVLGE